MKRIEVVAAVLQRDDGHFLLAERPAGKVYAGHWEFPGGKVEGGESAPQALARELHEELGIDVKKYYRWITRDYDYEHAAVRLRFYRVTAWSGALRCRERQQLAWQHTGALSVSPLLPANAPVIRALSLPAVYGVSNALEVGCGIFLRRLRVALQNGLRLVQIREKKMPQEDFTCLVTKALALTSQYGASVLLNAAEVLVKRLGAPGIHLTAERLMALESRPDLDWVSASCHDKTELARAAQMGLDFVVLGPVAETASHPGMQPLGWNRFSELIADYALPVYAIGGLSDRDLPTAWEAGAHGIAAIRGAWPQV